MDVDSWDGLTVFQSLRLQFCLIYGTLGISHAFCWGRSAQEDFFIHIMVFGLEYVEQQGVGWTSVSLFRPLYMANLGFLKTWHSQDSQAFPKTAGFSLSLPKGIGGHCKAFPVSEITFTTSYWSNNVLYNPSEFKGRG